MTKPLISIIIPFYNVEAYLRACLDSVLRQTVTDFECLLIDDKSTDKSASIAASYCSTDSRLRLISLDKNGGQSKARNIGLDEAKGEYLTFIDSDDIVHHSFLEQNLKLLTRHHADICMTGLTYHELKDSPSLDSSPMLVNGKQAIKSCLYQCDGFNPSFSGKLFRSKLFQSGIRFKENIIYEDLELMPRVWEQAGKIVAAPSLKLYHYRQRPGSTTHTYTPSRLDVLKVTESICARYSTDKDMKLAADDRRLAANFNMFLLLSAHGDHKSDDALDCWAQIVRLRWQSLTNPNVRIKNKIGILASYVLGRYGFAKIGKMC